MSWDKINNHELQAMRKLLMLSVSEAAELIGTLPKDVESERIKNNNFLRKKYKTSIDGPLSRENCEKIESRLNLVNGWMDLVHVSERTWQYWESGRSNIPEGIEEEIYALIQQRNDKIEELTGSQESNKTLELEYYHTFEMFLKDHPAGNKVNWRLHQAAVSFIFSEIGDVELL